MGAVGTVPAVFGPVDDRARASIGRRKAARSAGVTASTFTDRFGSGRSSFFVKAGVVFLLGVRRGPTLGVSFTLVEVAASAIVLGVFSSID